MSLPSRAGCPCLGTEPLFDVWCAMLVKLYCSAYRAGVSTHLTASLDVQSPIPFLDVQLHFPSPSIIAVDSIIAVLQISSEPHPFHGGRSPYPVPCSRTSVVSRKLKLSQSRARADQTRCVHAVQLDFAFAFVERREQGFHRGRDRGGVTGLVGTSTARSHCAGVQPCCDACRL